MTRTIENSNNANSKNTREWYSNAFIIIQTIHRNLMDIKLEYVTTMQ